MFLSAVLLLANYAVAQDYRPVTSLFEIRKQNVTTQEWDLSYGLLGAGLLGLGLASQKNAAAGN
jgi:hypothetical protein